MQQQHRFISKLLVGMGVIMYMITYFYRSSLTPIIDAFENEFSATSTELGVLASAYWYVFVALQLPGGILVQFITSEFVFLISWTCFTITLFLFSLPFNTEYILIPTIIFLFSGFSVFPLLLSVW